MTWYIQKESGETFGPVELDELQSWTADGRIAPQDRLSEDQHEWIYAANLEPLHMYWVLQMEEGQEYGPLHAMYVEQLLAEGDLDPLTSAVHKDNKDVMPVWELALASSRQVVQHLQAALDAVRSNRSEDELELDQVVEEVNGLRKKLSELEESHKELLKSYRDLNDRYIEMRQGRPSVAAEKSAPEMLSEEERKESKKGRTSRIRLR